MLGRAALEHALDDERELGQAVDRAQLRARSPARTSSAVGAHVASVVLDLVRATN